MNTPNPEAREARAKARLLDWGGFDRIIDWLVVKASDYCLWVHHRELRYAERNNQICPNCESPLPFCYCRERERDDEMCQSAFDAGVEHAMENARYEEWR